jgi:hypothetical protein
MNINKEYSYTPLTFFFKSKGWAAILLIFLLYQFYNYLITKDEFSSVMFALSPLLIISLVSIFIYIEKAIYPLIISQFILVIATGYFDLPLGIYSLISAAVLILLLIIKNIYTKVDLQHGKNSMLVIFLVWGVFCLGEIGNPNNVQEAWNISITHYAFYPILCAILVPMAIKKNRHIEWLYIIWSIFIIIVATKGFIQKTYGFNAKEMNDLFVLGKAKTHIIWSGIRYFSYFTDAANYGVHMAMGATVFALLSYYSKNYLVKIYYLLIVGMAIYGMGISGTRSAIGVPLGAIALFILLSKNKNSFIVGIFALVIMTLFFRFTTIGNSNEYIRKMRSAFYAEQDDSYQVRVENRKKISALMVYKPFGYGIGLAGKADRFHPKEVMPYPPDSWLVSVWIDTGVIGLVCYIIAHFILFIICAWILLFKIKNQRLKGLLTAWLCANAGYFVAAYANDVMQYPNSIIVYTGFALCFAGVHIDKKLTEEEEENKKNIPIL